MLAGRLHVQVQRTRWGVIVGGPACFLAHVHQRGFRRGVVVTAQGGDAVAVGLAVDQIGVHKKGGRHRVQHHVPSPSGHLTLNHAMLDRPRRVLKHIQPQFVVVRGESQPRRGRGGRQTH